MITGSDARRALDLWIKRALLHCGARGSRSSERSARQIHMITTLHITNTLQLAGKWKVKTNWWIQLDIGEFNIFSL